MKAIRLLVLIAVILTAAGCKKDSNTGTGPGTSTGAVLIDHTMAKLSVVPAEWIVKAREELCIAYGHTSHGSQLVDGMRGLVEYRGSLYQFSQTHTDTTLELRDMPFSGASDLGAPNRTAWEAATRTYLNAHPEVNVIIWSWCGEVSNATEADINLYLSLMNGLETSYPKVKFVYMTGHLDGTGVTGNLYVRNEQIRKYCRDNKKWLYDFADIESYDPDGSRFVDKHANDACDYDSDTNGSLDANWAVQWQNAHPGAWYQCSAAHSQPLNGNLKAYAAWNLWARLAGWSGSVL